MLIYVLRLADVCGVDLAAAALRKIELNARATGVVARDSLSRAEFERAQDESSERETDTTQARKYPADKARGSSAKYTAYSADNDADSSK